MEDKKDTCMNLMQEYPASFRVLGIGEDTKEIIERIKEFGFEGVSASVVEEGEVCGPTEETKLAFIVSVNDVPRADSIAKSFHEAGVLTLGLSPDADPLCYDSVGYGVMIHDYPSVVKEILKPVATPGYISYDFDDLSTTLGNSGFFRLREAEGERIPEVAAKLKKELRKVSLKNVEYLSFHIYFNRERSVPIKVNEIGCLPDLMNSLPESIDMIFSVHFDSSLVDNQTRIVAVMAGEKLRERKI